MEILLLFRLISNNTSRIGNNNMSSDSYYYLYALTNAEYKYIIKEFMIKMNILKPTFLLLIKFEYKYLFLNVVIL